MNSTKLWNYSEAVLTSFEDSSKYINNLKSTNLSDTNSLCSTKNRNKIIVFIESVIKRIIDIIAGIIGLLIIIPLTIIVFISNKLCKDNGPIFYVQERIGKDGKIFKMLKYRSMVVGAEEKLEEYLKVNEEARKEYEVYKKLRKDPRITRIGRILRKTSLDEIPQLLHLLDGSMSLVGPRPYLVSEKKDMGEYYNIIVKNKPRNYWFMASKWKIKYNI